MHFIEKAHVVLATAPIVAALAAGCIGGGPEALSSGASLSELGVAADRSYADVVPAEHQTEIRALRSPDEESPPDENAPTAILSAADGRAFFPMPRETRRFESQGELAQFIADRFGAKELFYDDETDELVGAQGSYVQYGNSFFEDAEIGVRYRVTDPIMALVGGVTGRVEVGGEVWCVDMDGDCDSERASYLEPDGFATAPTHIPRCSGSNCVQFHSFFNQSWFPAPWARHGSNVIYTSGSPSSGSQLITSGQYHVPLGGSDWATYSLPLVNETGVPSVETAAFCFGSTSCPPYLATAVCGNGTSFGSVFASGVRTGNGPANNSRCPG